MKDKVFHKASANSVFDNNDPMWGPQFLIDGKLPSYTGSSPDNIATKGGIYRSGESQGVKFIQVKKVCK